MTENYIKCFKNRNFSILEILAGELDLIKSPTVLKLIKNVLAQIDHPDTIIDLKHLSYIDSTGLGILIATKNLLEKHDRETVLVCNSRKILQVFEIAKMHNFFKVFETPEEASKYFDEKSS